MAEIANYHRPHIATHPDVNANFCAVLVRDGERTYRCYAALIPLGDDPRLPPDPEVLAWIAARGTKLRYEEALTHFPMVKREQYS